MSQDMQLHILKVIKPGLIGRYIFGNLFLSVLFISAVLASIIILSQSIRFIELIIEAGASSRIFLLLVIYALPRFLEIILPISVFIGSLFMLNRLSSDSELTIMRNSGISPLSIAAPVVLVSLCVSLLLSFITLWLAPDFLSRLQTLRQITGSEYSALIFREGVFSTVDDNLTIYIENRLADGSFEGITVYDERPENPYPVIIMAQRGQAYNAGNDYSIAVYNGIRQEYNRTRDTLSQLSFDQYNINIPAGDGLIDRRWKKPNERSFPELVNPDLSDPEDAQNAPAFLAEAHRRIATIMLPPAFGILAALTFLIGPYRRRGYNMEIIVSITLGAFIQGVFLAGFNMADQSFIGVFLLYAAPLLPIFCGLFLLARMSRRLKEIKI